MTFIVVTILLVLSLIVCVLALIKGGDAERIGAGVIIANLIAGVVNERWLHVNLVHLAIAGVTALALLAVALRYASFWVGGVMILYALQFAVDAYYLVAEQKRDALYILANNVLFSVITLCLAAGTVLAWRRRLKTGSIAA